MNTAAMLKDGLTDAAGFLGGALLGLGAGHLLGLETFTGTFGNSALGGILLVGLGGGLGLQLARRWRRRLTQGQKLTGEQPGGSE